MHLLELLLFLFAIASMKLTSNMCSPIKFATTILLIANTHCSNIANEVQKVICSEGGELCDLMVQELDMVERLNPFLSNDDKSQVGKKYLSDFLRSKINRVKRDVAEIGGQEFSTPHFVDQILRHFAIDHVITIGLRFRGTMVDFV